MVTALVCVCVLAACSSESPHSVGNALSPGSQLAVSVGLPGPSTLTSHSEEVLVHRAGLWPEDTCSSSGLGAMTVTHLSML